MNILKKTSLGIMTLALLLLTACSPQSKLPQNQNPEPASNQSNSSGSANLSTKMNAYVDCLNNQSDPIFYARGLYLKFVDPEKGPTGDEPSLTIAYQGNISSCIDGIKSAQSANPRIENLEKAGEVYVATLQTIHPLLTEAHKYFDQQDYKDDGMAKGKELHPKLIEAWGKLAVADETLRTEVNKINKEQQMKELAELEKTQGRKAPFLVRNTLLFAEAIVDATEAEDLQSINLETLTQTIDDYDKAVKELDDYLSKNGDSGSTLVVRSFVYKANELLKASKDLMRRIRDNEPYSASDETLLGGATEWMVDGSPGKVVYEYNALIQNYNSIVNTLE